MKREDCEKGLYVSFLWEGVEKIGKIDQLGPNVAWIDCLGSTWAVSYGELSKAPADKALEYIESEALLPPCDKIAEAELRPCKEVVGSDKEQETVKVSSIKGRHVNIEGGRMDTDLSGITFDILAVRKCPEGNYIGIVYQGVNGKVDVVFIRAGDYRRILSEDFQGLYNYKKVKEEYAI